MPAPDVFVNGLQRCLQKNISRFPEHDVNLYQAFQNKWNEKGQAFGVVTKQKNWEQTLFFELRKAMWPKAPPGDKKDGQHDAYTKSIYDIWQASMHMVGRETISRFRAFETEKLKGDLKERFEKRFDELWNHKNPEYNDKQIVAELEKIFGSQIQKDFREFKGHVKKARRPRTQSELAEEAKQKAAHQKRQSEISIELLVKLYHSCNCKEKECILTNRVRMKITKMAQHIKACKNKSCKFPNCSLLKRLVSHSIKCKNSDKPCPNHICDEVDRRLKELNAREINWDQTITTNEEIKYDMNENTKGRASASYDVMYDVDEDVNEADNAQFDVVIVPDDDDDDDDDDEHDDDNDEEDEVRGKEAQPNNEKKKGQKRKKKISIIKENESEMMFPEIPIEHSVKTMTENLLKKDLKYSKMIPRKSFRYISDSSVPTHSMRIGEGVVKLLTHAVHRHTTSCLESAAKRARYRVEDRGVSDSVHITTSDVLIPASRYQSSKDAWIDDTIRNSLLRQKNLE